MARTWLIQLRPVAYRVWQPVFVQSKHPHLKPCICMFLPRSKPQLYCEIWQELGQELRKGAKM